MPAKYGYSLSFSPPGFLLPSLLVKCDSMSFLSFTLYVKRSQSFYMFLVDGVISLVEVWCLISARCSLKQMSRAHPVSLM